jgi:hypothetical protein
MEPFAKRGFDGAVSERSSARPARSRLGALYEHFKGGKEELLRAAIEGELRAIDELGSVMDMLPLGDLHAELTLLARWNLGSLDRRSALARLVRGDVARVPTQLRDELYDRWSLTRTSRSSTGSRVRSPPAPTSQICTHSTG